MADFNLRTHEIECKLVYYGPGRGGKTTNLDYIFKSYKKQITGEMVSINTEGDRTLFFDFLPMGLGKIKGWNVRVQLYTVPGQVHYKATRRLVLKGVDGLVFVADSLAIRRDKNILSLKDLHANLKSYGLSIFKVPLVLQYNKRDLDKSGFPMMSIAQMEKDINRQLKVPYYCTSALTGDGVGETLKRCLALTFKKLQQQMG